MANQCTHYQMCRHKDHAMFDDCRRKTHLHAVCGWWGLGLITRLPKVIWQQAALHHKLPIGYNGAPHIRPGHYSLPWTDSQTQLTCRIPGPIQPTIPNCIHIRSAILPQCTGQRDRQTYTHRPTNGWRERLMTIGRFRSIESAVA